jgi:hypothetical protein
MLTFRKSRARALEARRSPRRRRRGRRRQLLVADQAHADGACRTDRGAHRLEHLDGEPHAVLEAAAVLVAAPVAARREELVSR